MTKTRQSPPQQPEWAKAARDSLGRYYLSIFPGYAPVRYQQKEVIPHLEAVERGDITRLMVFMPPGHSKTEIGTKSFIPWYLSRNPNKNAILVCHTDPLARDFGSAIRDTMQAGIAHRQIFPEVIVSVSNKASNFFRTNRGNAFYAFGMDGGATGRRANLLVIDDPIKTLQDALSETVQNDLHNTYKGVLKDRLRPDAAIVVNMTRWATRDMAARILDEEGARWSVLVLAAQSHIEGCVTPMACTCPYLWEDFYGRKHYEDFKTDSYIWQAKWQQTPRPALSKGFQQEWLRFWLPLGATPEYRDDPDGGPPVAVALPTDHRKLYKYNAYIIVDPAMGKSAAHDRTCMLVLVAGPELRLFLVDAVLDRLDPSERIDEFIRLYRKWKPKQVLWEEYALAADTFWLEKTLRAQGIREDQLIITSVGRKGQRTLTGESVKGGRLSKDDRIAALGSDFKAGRIWLPKKMVRRCQDGTELDIMNYFINHEYLPWAGEGSIAHDDFLDCLARIHDQDAFFEHAERPDAEDEQEYESVGGGGEGSWESRYAHQGALQRAIDIASLSILDVCTRAHLAPPGRRAPFDNLRLAA